MDSKKTILDLIYVKTHFFSFEKEYVENKLITFLSPIKYIVARKHLEYVEGFDVINIDGYSLLSLLKRFKIISSLVVRRSFDFSSLADSAFQYASKNQLKVCLIGTHPFLIGKAIQNIKEKYPTLNIVFYRDGYFKNKEDELDTTNRIIAENPDIVICGMGIGKQELFLLNLRKLGWRGTGVTCGGFLHQISAGLDYFPEWSNKYNLRWLYRLYREPNLLYTRFYKILHFIILFLRDVREYKKR